MLVLALLFAIAEAIGWGLVNNGYYFGIGIFQQYSHIFLHPIALILYALFVLNIIKNIVLKP